MFWLNVFMSTKRIPGAPGPEEDIRSLGTEITGSCQPSCESWELNPGPPQEEQPLRHLPAPSSTCSHTFVAFLTINIFSSIRLSLRLKLTQPVSITCNHQWPLKFIL